MKIFILILFLFSCTKKEAIYTKEDLFYMAREKDPTAQLILPANINEAVDCSEYGEGCHTGHRVLVKGLEMIAVEFDTHANAMMAAKSIKAWVARNWLFDDVTGEPELEKFVKEAFDEAIPSTSAQVTK